MSHSETRNASSQLTLSEKLHVIRLHDELKSTTSIANDLNITEPVITEILQARVIHESFQKNLFCTEELMHGSQSTSTPLSRMNPNDKAVGHIFRVSRYAITRTRKSKDTVLPREKL